MADSGRILYKQVKADDRLVEYSTAGTAALPAVALAKASDLLRAGSVAIVGSGRSSVEEQFLTRKLADALKVSAVLVSRVGQGDKILVSADRNPNVRGALVTGLISALPETGGAATSPRAQNGSGVAAAPGDVRVGGLGPLAASIDAGQVKTILSVGEDLTAAGLTTEQLAKVAVIYLGTHRNATSEAAQVVIPTLTVFEKSGTLVNQQFRIQKFTKAVPGPAGVADDLVTLANLVAAAGGATLSSDLTGLWAAIAADVKPLALVSYANLPSTGLLLDSTPWAALPFVEGETLHFKPAAPAAVSA
jgi:NADH-quinone oxidoreductase subunit G